MIRNFRHKGLTRLYAKADTKGLPTELVPKIERVIARLDIATAPEMMNLPADWEFDRKMPMKEPPHPGFSVRLDCLEPLGLSITEGAKVLGVTRQALNNVVNG